MKIVTFSWVDIAEFETFQGVRQSHEFMEHEKYIVNVYKSVVE